MRGATGGLRRRAHDIWFCELETEAAALGPVAGALILDFADFATFGPLGLVIGWLVGGVTGWWISSLYGYRIRYRLFWSALAAIYCTIPFTAIVPLATIISLIARFYDD